MQHCETDLGLGQLGVHGHQGARQLAAGAVGALQRGVQDGLLQRSQVLLPLLHELVPRRLRKLACMHHKDPFAWIVHAFTPRMSSDSLCSCLASGLTAALQHELVEGDTSKGAP